MNNNKPFEFYLKKISIGIFLTIVFLVCLFYKNKNRFFGEIFFYEVIPYYNLNNNVSELFKWSDNSYIETNNYHNFQDDFNYDMQTDKSDEYKIEDKNVQNELESKKTNNTPVNADIYQDDVIGVDDVIFQPEADTSNIESHFVKENITLENIDKYRNINYLNRSFYIVDKRTGMTKEDFDVDKFLNTDLSIDISDDKPKVLIFHTHSMEMFKDSKAGDKNEGVYGAGEKLKQALESKYNIKCIHDDGSYDVVNGKTKILGAYERMEPNIRKILKENPYIEIAIDLHRDGVNENVHLVKNINGKPTAQIMFFNGLCKLNENGKLNNLTSLQNPYLSVNLAFSFNMQLTANNLYPGFTRKVYLNAYRYSLHMLPKSLLVEAGAQTNTKEEINNAMELLADILAQVILK